MFRPATTPAIVVAGAFGLVLVLVATVVAAFTLQHPATDAAVSGTPQPLGHVHGLGVTPEDGDLYVASHFGVFRIVDGELERVADRWQDTMASPSWARVTSSPVATPTCVRTCRPTSA